MKQLYVAHPCIDGYEVIDSRTGRAVSEPKPSRREANGLAQYLNREANVLLRAEDAAPGLRSRRTPPRKTVPSRRLAA